MRHHRPARASLRGSLVYDMKTEEFEAIWSSHTIDDIPNPKAPCQYANEFQGWASSQVEQAQYSPTQFLINEKMVIITKKYREYMRHIPEDHHILAKETGHKCVYAVWDKCCKTLEEAELKLTPQLPPRPTTPRPRKEQGSNSSDIGAIYEQNSSE